MTPVAGRILITLSVIQTGLLEAAAHRIVTAEVVQIIAYQPMAASPAAMKILLALLIAPRRPTGIP